MIKENIPGKMERVEVDMIEVIKASADLQICLAAGVERIGYLESR